MQLAEIKQDTRFIEDLESSLDINDNKSSRGIFNLIVSKRDIGLFCIGMKPHRHWRLKHVKEYFGLKGNKDKCKAQIEFLVDLFVSK